MSGCTFRVARLEDVARMLEWAAREGWNPGLDDAAAFHRSDPNGFFIAEIADEPVASISIVNHSNAFAFLGFYICRPEWRGKGIGQALWQHAMAHAGRRTVGLDGVAAQEANYARSGFLRTGATVRYEGRLDALRDQRIRALCPEDIDEIVRLDAEAGGVERQTFLRAWLSGTETRHTCILGAEGRIDGFATIRMCRDGAKIGPLVAPTTEAALALAQAAVAQFPDQRTIIDVPSSNTGLTAALRTRGFHETFATARMYRGLPPRMSAQLQAIATMELG